MGTRYETLEPQFIKFIDKQHIFFSGTAATDGPVNVSPKGMDSLRVLSPNRIIWRNMTGSGNETATHLTDNDRMTLMWCSFSGPPMILRCYGAARPVHRNDADWDELNAHFEPHFAARQIFDFSIDLVQKSCGYAVPEMDFVKGRDTLEKWAANKGEQGVREYWAERNGETLDGTPTLIAEKNL